MTTSPRLAALTATITRIHILSDVHNEFSRFSLVAVEADVVVLAGDIDLKERGLRWAK